MAPKQLSPQLVMRLANLDHLQAIELPEGFKVRHFNDGDEVAWENIIAKSFNRNVEPGEFEKTIKSAHTFKPERVLFITKEDVPVATACAWEKEKFGLKKGYVHIVGVLPNFQGKHLGYWVNLAVLHQFAAENKCEAILETDDYRLPAIKTYLKLGFRPHFVHCNHAKRWQNILTKLDPDGKYK